MNPAQGIRRFAAFGGGEDAPISLLQRRGQRVEDCSGAGGGGRLQVSPRFRFCFGI